VGYTEKKRRAAASQLEELSNTRERQTPESKTAAKCIDFADAIGWWLPCVDAVAFIDMRSE
jgi:hypothetical protein